MSWANCVVCWIQCHIQSISLCIHHRVLLATRWSSLVSGRWVRELAWLDDSLTTLHQHYSGSVYPKFTTENRASTSLVPVTWIIVVIVPASLSTPTFLKLARLAVVKPLLTGLLHRIDLVDALDSTDVQGQKWRYQDAAMWSPSGSAHQLYCRVEAWRSIRLQFRLI